MTDGCAPKNIKAGYQAGKRYIRAGSKRIRISALCGERIGMKIWLAIALLVFLSGCTGSGGTQPTPQGTNAVLIENFAFNPPTLTVKAGTTVTWTNEDTAAHTIKSDTFNSQELGKGGSFEFTFNNPGTYDYACGIHPSMKGTVTVTQ